MAPDLSLRCNEVDGVGLVEAPCIPILPISRFAWDKMMLGRREATKMAWKRGYDGVYYKIVGKGKKRISGNCCTEGVSLALVPNPCCCYEAFAYPDDGERHRYHRDSHDYDMSPFWFTTSRPDPTIAELVGSLVGAHYHLMEIVLGYLRINEGRLLLSPLFAVAGCRHSGLDIALSCKVVDVLPPKIHYGRPVYRRFCLEYCLDNMIFQKLRDRRSFAEIVAKGDYETLVSMEAIKKGGSPLAQDCRGHKFFSAEITNGMDKWQALEYYRSWEWLYVLCKNPLLLSISLIDAFCEAAQKTLECFPSMSADKRRVMISEVSSAVGSFTDWHISYKGSPSDGASEESPMLPVRWGWKEHPTLDRSYQLQERFGGFPLFEDRLASVMVEEGFRFGSDRSIRVGHCKIYELQDWARSQRRAKVSPDYSPTPYPTTRAEVEEIQEAAAEREAMADQAQGPEDPGEEMFKAQLEMARIESLKTYSRDPEETETEGEEEPILAQSQNLDYPYEEEEEVVEVAREVIDLTQEEEPRIREARFLARMEDV